MNVRDKITRYLKEKNISYEQISAFTGISSKKLKNIFDFKTDISVKNYVSICKCLNVDITYFF